LLRNLSFNLMQMPDGTIGAYPPNMTGRFYRGECDVFDNCYPSIYRTSCGCDKDYDGSRAKDLILIDTLKMLEFELIIKTFPQVKYAIEDFCNVDFYALAQHYELKTNLIDLTCDLAVAAFFATSSYDADIQEFVVREEGVGCLRSYINITIDYNPNQPFKLIGLQPFQRPGLQCAFALRLNKGEDFANLSAKLLFKQNKKWNKKLRDAFYEGGKNILFPREDIADIASMLKTSKYVSNDALKLYCNQNNIFEEDVAQTLKKHGIALTDDKAYKLTRQNRRRLERVYKDRPYGDVKLRSRLSYLPHYNSVEK
jgi:hypothetical protein